MNPLNLTTINKGFTDHDGPGDDCLVLGVGLDPVVEGYGVKDVQQLTLVFVNPFHLNNERRKYD